MKEVIKVTGSKYVDYTNTTKSIIFGDDDLSINLKNREKDETVTIDVCLDANGELTMGTAAGLKYVAQVEIPARQYTETTTDNPDYDPEDEMSQATIVTREPVPFDIDNCTVYLWGMEE